MRVPLLFVCLAVHACATVGATDTVASTDTAAKTPSAGPQLMELPTLESPKVRLPAGVRPLSYRLALTIVPGTDRFSGEIVATVQIDRPLEVLWINATQLDVTATSLFTERGERSAQAIVVDDHFVALVPRCDVAEKGSCLVSTGRQDVRLTFSGPLSRKDVDALFQVKEGDDWYAYTSFEPIDARRAFPNFDEPQFKVPWTVSLTVKAGHSALANTPQVKEEALPDGMKRVTFAASKPLPSYLVAFAVGPFEFVDAGKHGRNQTPIRIVTPKGKAGEAKWAAESSGPILAQLEAYFGSPYPYEKLDQISIQANTGAMENPGLVTYGHQTILSKPEVDTPGRQRGFASVCTHELAHQWFGDLVTMAWWDDLWLNEAFATWMTPRILEKWQPTWAMDVAQVNRRHGALGSDAMVNARQIRQPIVSNDDIANAFDGITYGKGASVIGMFENWMGRETFQKGVRAYLEKHAWRNATAADFLESISVAAGKDVATPFRTFLDQPGGPTIDFALSCGKGTPTLTLTQRRSLPIGSKGDAAKVWQVPVCVRWSEKGKQARACTVLTEASGTLELSGAKSCPEWVLPNDRGDGYYRASLTGPLSLADVYRKAGTALSTPERIALLGDVSALVRSGDLDAAVMLELATLAAKETDRHVFGYALGFASIPGGDLLPEALRPKHEAFVRELFSKRLEAIGFDPKATDDEDLRLLRPQLIATLGRVGKDRTVLAKAREAAARWLDDRKAIHPDLLDVTLGLAGEAGDAAFHERVLAVARKETDRGDRGRLLGALAELPDATLVAKQLPLILTDAFETRESMRLLWGAAGDFRTRGLALDFARTHWDELIIRLPKDSGAGLVWLAGGVCTESEQANARSFFEGRSTRYLGGPRTFALAMENMELCVAFRARQRASMISFFEKRGAAKPIGPAR